MEAVMSNHHAIELIHGLPRKELLETIHFHHRRGEASERALASFVARSEIKILSIILLTTFHQKTPSGRHQAPNSPGGARRRLSGASSRRSRHSTNPTHRKPCPATLRPSPERRKPGGRIHAASKGP